MLEAAASASAGEGRERVVRELAALAILAFAALTLVSLLSDALVRGANLGGIIGAAAAGTLDSLFGFQAYVAAILAGWLATRVWRGVSGRVLAREMIGAGILLAAICAGAGLVTAGDRSAGGALGTGLASSLGLYLNLTGGYIAVALATLTALVVMRRRPPTELVAGLARSIGLRRDGAAADASGGTNSVLATDAGAEATRAWAIDSAAAADPKSPASASAPPLKVHRLERRDSPPRDASPPAHARSKDGFRLPPPDLLDTPPAEHTQVDEAALENSARVVEQKLADFGVNGRVVEVQPGPVVTMYKFEPGSGIKVSQIVNLADDLSMALRASTVRIQAPVPGEAVVGIEVPNRQREMVYLREILEAEEYAAAHSHLTIALGKDISGRPVAANLAAMPHLLIAGATGTGKSVSIHTMIASVLFNATADDVRFILIDPKMLELSVYENIPHLLVPVVVDPEKAAAALLWATQEMENRYRLMRDSGVRNIDGYNRLVESGALVVELKPSNVVTDDPEDDADDAEEPPEWPRKLPKIVIVIDELADLLLSEGKTVERDITRLAQKARASGIHLILATQRPSVDVITGLIKANLPARISFQVTSRVDSRTILDSIGAERLLGAGDMLFMPPGSAKLRRLHGPFVSETEIRKLVDFLRAQGAPEYRMEILETVRPSDDGGEGGGQQDELYDEAVRIVIETNQASISMIQRRLRVGYNRAARMVEQMEREGLVTPGDGMRPREVRARDLN